MLIAPKKRYLSRLVFLSLALMLAIVSCKKKENIKEPVIESVMINGTGYPTVKIGRQLWTSVNYNGAGGVNYNNGANDAAYGKLYTRQEAQAIVLPEGWRLPSKEDFEKMVASFPYEIKDGYTMLKADGLVQILSMSGWRDKNGNNASGFNALPAGFPYVDAGGNIDFEYRGIETQFISSSNEMVSNGGTTRPKTWTLYLHSEAFTTPQPFTDFNGGVNEVLNSDWYRFSVRFVKDVQ